MRSGLIPGKRAERIVKAIENGARTARELAVMFETAPNRIAPELSRLELMGEIKRGPARMDGAAGRPCVTWWRDERKQLDRDLGSSLKIDAVMKATADHFGCTLQELIAPTRDFILGRQIAMYLARAYCDRSLHQIGFKLGGYDENTVLYAIRRTRLRYDSEPVFAARVDRILEAARKASEGAA